MAAAKKRINITLPKEAEKLLEKAAKREQIPAASKAAGLIVSALEMEEDLALSELASKREKTPRFISHKKVWG